jgi:hypothetical protein
MQGSVMVLHIHFLSLYLSQIIWEGRLKVGAVCIL